MINNETIRTQIQNVENEKKPPKKSNKESFLDGKMDAYYNLDRLQAEQMLSKSEVKNPSLIRDSSIPNALVLSVYLNSKYYHFLLEPQEDGFFCESFGTKTYNKIQEFMNDLSGKYGNFFLLTPEKSQTNSIQEKQKAQDLYQKQKEETSLAQQRERENRSRVLTQDIQKTIQTLIDECSSEFGPPIGWRLNELEQAGNKIQNNMEVLTIKDRLAIWHLLVQFCNTFSELEIRQLAYDILGPSFLSTGDLLKNLDQEFLNSAKKLRFLWLDLNWNAKTVEEMPDSPLKPGEVRTGKLKDGSLMFFYPDSNEPLHCDSFQELRDILLILQKALKST